MCARFSSFLERSGAIEATGIYINAWRKTCVGGNLLNKIAQISGDLYAVCKAVAAEVSVHSLSGTAKSNSRPYPDPTKV